MCQLDIFISIYDRDTRKIFEYNSGGIDTDPFCFERVQDTLRKVVDGTFSKIIYTDCDYEKLQQN